ncbi:MAG: hypothetical protein GQF41_4301 [Candidatus Rifleibacterium amylolyticum]|nr:MAG: hypothetical protein GQF41_4301 [Candidatus Rifleibacterium amylolyticum]
MVISFGVKNFFCFEDGAEVSFKIPKTDENPRGIATSICVKGANASGKTNLVKALAFMRHFICDSFAAKPESEIPFYSHFDNDSPSEFYLEFTHDKKRYFYELALTKNKVISESLSRVVRRKSLLFKRTNNDITECIEEFSDLKKINFRNNCSAISTAHQFEFKPLEPVYFAVQNIYPNVDLFGYKELILDSQELAKLVLNDDKFREFATSLLKDSDTGIHEIKVKRIKTPDGKETYMPFFVYRKGDKKHSLGLLLQSRGIKTLFNQAYYYYNALQEGGLLIVDEIDVGLHPDIVEALVSMFDNPKLNTRNAQLIFTTHSENIMDRVGKYRIVMVEKRDNASFVYRLDELPGSMIRNDRAILPLYRAKKIGGVPRLGKTFQNQ